MLARGFGTAQIAYKPADGSLNDEACLRLLAAVVLQWWRDAEQLDDLAEFLGVPEHEVRGVRPQRIDRWRRKELIGERAEEGDEDVYF